MSIKLKISYIFFFLVIGNLLVNGQSTASTKEDEAYRLHENKEYTKAAEIYEELLKTDYKNTYLLSMCGSSYFAQKKYEKAKEKYSWLYYILHLMIRKIKHYIIPICQPVIPIWTTMKRHMKMQCAPIVSIIVSYGMRPLWHKTRTNMKNACR